MTQSWYRKGMKKAKERAIKEKKKEKRHNILLCISEYINKYMFILILVTFVLLVMMMLLILSICGADWIIAVLSLELMIISLWNSRKSKSKIPEFKKFFGVILGFTLLMYFLILVFYERIPENWEKFIGTYVSSGCLLITFVLEMYKPFKAMQEESDEKIKSLKEKIK